MRMRNKQREPSLQDRPAIPRPNKDETKDDKDRKAGQTHHQDETTRNDKHNTTKNEQHETFNTKDLTKF